MGKSKAAHESKPAADRGELVRMEFWVRRFPAGTMFFRQNIAEGQFQHADGPDFEVSQNLYGGGYLCRIGDSGYFLLGPGEFASGCLEVAQPAASVAP